MAMKQQCSLLHTVPTHIIQGLPKLPRDVHLIRDYDGLEASQDTQDTQVRAPDTLLIQASSDSLVGCVWLDADLMPKRCRVACCAGASAWGAIARLAFCP